MAELVHLAETLVKVEKLGDRTQPLAEILCLRRQLGHFLEEFLRVDVAIDVDQWVAGHRFPRPAAHAALNIQTVAPFPWNRSRCFHPLTARRAFTSSSATRWARPSPLPDSPKNS